MAHLYKSIVCTHCGKLIRVPIYCKDRFCDVCGPGRRFRVQQKIKYLLKCAVYPRGYFLGMMTLSLRNTKTINMGISELSKSFRRLRHSKLWKSSIRGGLYVIEITGEPGSWHPHLHVLVEQKFISWKTFRDRWKSITGATAFHVKRIPAGAAERYITKYIAKPSADPTVLIEISKELRHVRLFQPFGTWHGLIKSYTKPSYPCPECGECVWQPFEEMFRENLPRRANKRAPPAVVKVNKQAEIEHRPATRQAEFGDVLKYSRPENYGEYVPGLAYKA